MLDYQNSQRIPNPKDPDYFYPYENPEWKPASLDNQIFNFIYRCLYFMTGPKFVVPTLGIVCPKKLLDDLKSGKYYILNVFKGHLDVGDRCLRSNVLVTSLRCW